MSAALIPRARVELVHDVLHQIIHEVLNAHKGNEESDKAAYYQFINRMFVWLGETRLVSHEFNTMIIPIVYKIVHINTAQSMERLMSPVVGIHIQRNIQDYATFLQVVHWRNLQLQLATHNLIRECKKLNCLLWDACEGAGLQFQIDTATIASIYVDAFLKNENKWKRCRFTTKESRFIVGKYPIPPEKKHKLECTQKDEASRYPKVYLDLLVIDINLGQVTWLIPTYGATRLPPMKKLKLINYPWKYSEHNAAEIYDLWDFSMLRKLSLTHVNLDSFFGTINHSLLLNLESLTITDFIDSYCDDQKSKFREQFRTLLEQLRHLKSFKLSYDAYLSVVSPNTMKQWSDKLVVLELRGLEICQMMTPSQVQELLDPCAKLQRLSVDIEMDMEDGTHRYLLNSIAEKKELKELDLWAHDNLGLEGVQPNSTDPDYDAAIYIMDNLRRYKDGCPFNSVTIWLRGGRPPRLTTWPAYEEVDSDDNDAEEGDEEEHGGLMVHGRLRRNGILMGPLGIGGETDTWWHSPGQTYFNMSISEDSEDGSGSRWRQFTSIRDQYGNITIEEERHIL